MRYLSKSIAYLVLGTALVSSIVGASAAPTKHGPTGFLGDTGQKVDVNARQGKAYGDAVAQMPNWNGVWEVTQEVPIGAFDPQTAENIHDGKVGLDFGITPGGRMHPPYKAKYEKEYTALVLKTKKTGSNDDPDSFCRPEGVPRVYATPGDVEIIVTPKVTWMIWAYFANIRRIYTDGRSHPPADVSFGTDQGHSVGHWDGSTLVIDTVNMLPGAYDQSGAPYSDKLHMIEHVSMISNGQLKSEITLEDPVMFTKPWHITRYLNRVKLQPEIAKIKGPGPNWKDVESIHCTANRNQADENGNQSVQLPGDKNYEEPAASKHYP